MKLRNFFLGINIFLLITSLFSCSNESLGPIDNQETENAFIEVLDKGFKNDSLQTKTSESSYVTTFTQGDMIGVFVVDKTTNEILYSNEPIRYDAGSRTWTGDLRFKNDNRVFYAYYPYSKEMDSYNPTIGVPLSSESFFNEYITDVELPEDQSTQDKYTKADIMIGEGIVSTLSSAKKIVFTMSHCMSLIELEFPEWVDSRVRYYLKGDDNYEPWERLEKVNVGISDVCLRSKGENKPYFYNFNGNYRYIVKPGSYNIEGSFNTTTKVPDRYGNTIDETILINRTISSLDAGNYYHRNVSVKKGLVFELDHTLKIGDFYQNDGGLVSVDRDWVNNPLIEEYKEMCVGIVFQTDVNRIGSAEKADLYSKGVKPHGLVMALRNAGKGAWCSSSIFRDEVLVNYNTKNDMYNDISGLDNCIRIKKSVNLYSEYQAFNIAESYSAHKPEDRVTNWFLPSTGQWYDILEKIGDTDFSNASNGVVDGDFYFSLNNIAPTIADNLNKKMMKLGQSFYDEFYITKGQYYIYWCSSESSINRGRRVIFDIYNTLIVSFESKNFADVYIRPILAF